MTERRSYRDVLVGAGASQQPQYNGGQQKRKKSVKAAIFKAPSIQKIAPSSASTVPREDQLMEGSFLEWLVVIIPILQSSNLWSHIKFPPPPADGSNEWEAWSAGDVRAVDILINHIEPAFLSRLPIAPPMSAYQLFAILERRSRNPFRFLDLPRELRDLVYEYALVVPEKDRHDSWGYRHPKYAFSTDVNSHHPHIETHPALLGVNKQIRGEADEVYWGKNEWAIDLDSKIAYSDGGWWQDYELLTLREQFRRWVNKIGPQRLHHLRDFTLGVELCFKPSRCDAIRFRVVLDEKQDRLDVRLPEGPTWGCHQLEVRRDVQEQHVAAVEKRRKEKGWKGEAIIDYFLSDKEWWTEWFFTYPGIELVEFE